MTTCSRFTFTLRDGSTIWGAAQGSGGAVSVDGLNRIRRAIAGKHGHSVVIEDHALLVSPQRGTVVRVQLTDIVDVAESPSLDDELHNAGFRQRHWRGYKHEVLDIRGDVVFTGSAHETAEWLRGRAA